ncbi:MAG: hypothetical protein ACRDP6_42570 [Actinoallomurus sp.]
MRVFPGITAVAAAVLLLASCSGSHDTAVPPTPTATPTPTFDGSTLAACREAHTAAVGTDPDNEHAKLARGDAELSDVVTLRELARKYSDAPAGSTLDGVRALTAAYEVETWCVQHGIKQ